MVLQEGLLAAMVNVAESVAGMASSYGGCKCRSGC